MNLTTVDFETYGIEPRPNYPPKPVGVSIKHMGKPAVYYAWGHVTGGNNCTQSQARDALARVWDSGDELLFHNSKFDLDVAETFFQLPLPPSRQIHDTLFLVFLNDPRQKSMGLKPSAEVLLGLPPTEQNAVRDWLLTHQPVQGITISDAKKSQHMWGRYIAYAPGDIVGSYANGDVERTEALYTKLYPNIIARGMEEAYERELKLMLVLLQMERNGLPVDLKQLRSDTYLYKQRLIDIDHWLDQLLSCSGINYDSGAQLMDVLIKAKKVNPANMPLTEKTGKYQTNKDALATSITDPVLLSVLKYRAQLGTCVSTFMEPWLITAEQSGGFIYTSWNQVRQDYHSGDNTIGASTGRITGTPNLQNIPKEFDYESLPFIEPWMPLVRSYITPFPGEYLIDRDYSQQELRILAHFDGSELQKRYLENPWLDLHDYASGELQKQGLVYPRKTVKNTNFALIYGMGVGKLAVKNDMDYHQAAVLKTAVLKLYPGLSEMYREVKIRARTNQPVRTWGGREYYCEPPAIIDGRVQEYDYKLVNVIIQGSAGDCTKEAMIRFAKAKEPDCRVMLTVHDELAASSKRLKSTMECMKESMNSVEFDVPILSEGSCSKKNWAALIDYDKRGKNVIRRA